MENRKFLSYVARSLAFIMIVSLVYTLTSRRVKKVEAYNIGKETYYSGSMVNNKFNGNGKLKSSRGTYEGSFKNGRFDGDGTFTGDDFTYEANFSKDKGNKNIKIKLSNGHTYTKVGDTFKNKDVSDED